MTPVSKEATANWIRDILSRIEARFTDNAASESCEKLSELEKEMTGMYSAQPSQVANQSSIDASSLIEFQAVVRSRKNVDK